MNYRVTHETEYTYTETVNVAHSRLCLEPRTVPGRQRLLACDLHVFPAQPHMTARTDFFGNRIRYVGIDEPHRQMRVRCVSTVEAQPSTFIEMNASPPWEQLRDAVKTFGTPEYAAACAFRFDSPLVRVDPGVAQMVQACFPPGRPLLAGVSAYTAAIHDAFEYDPTATTVATPVSTVLRNRRGVCQDFAHVQIQGLRSLGLPARYVSGYVRTGNVPAPQGRERKIVGADASHAWVSVYAGETWGWVEFDPTNDVVASDAHIVVAYGRDFSDVSPVKGLVLGGGDHKLEVRVHVEELPDGQPAA